MTFSGENRTSLLRTRVTLQRRPCYPLASQIAPGVNLMRNIFSAILLFACAAISPAQQNGSASHFDGNSWWAHVKFLADDSLEGRDTGSVGLRKAQAYALEQLQKAGLDPRGINGSTQASALPQYYG